MELEPVKSIRIYEDIVRQVKTLIADGRLTSGDRLPPERELAERFRVSRTSVREALRSLQSRGLIEIRAGEGAFVRDISVEALIEPLAARRATSEEIGEMQRILAEQAREVESDAREWPRTQPFMPLSPPLPTI